MLLRVVCLWLPFSWPLSCVLLCGVLISVDANCDWYATCGECVADSGCGWCSNDPKGPGVGLLSSVAGNDGKDVTAVDDEGNTVPGSDFKSLLENNLVAVRGQYKRMDSVDDSTSVGTLESQFRFEGSGVVLTPYFLFTEYDDTRGMSVVGVHKTKFLSELKAGYTVKPYKQDVYTVQSVQSDTMISLESVVTTSFTDLEYQIGNYQVSGTMSYPDTSKTELYGSYAPNPTSFTTELRSGYTISTGTPSHSDSSSPARVNQVVHDALVVLSEKFIQTFENEPVWVVTGGRGTGLISGTLNHHRITGSNPCDIGQPCYPETQFLDELRVNDVVQFNGNSRLFTVAAVHDDAHFSTVECLGDDGSGGEFYDSNGVKCVGMTSSTGGYMNTLTTFTIKTFHRAAYTYAREKPGAAKSMYSGVSSRAQTTVDFDITSLGGAGKSVTEFLAANYAIIVETQEVNGVSVYERRMVKKITSATQIIVDRKFDTPFNNHAAGRSKKVYFESCPGLTYESYPARVENGVGLISGTGARYVYDNTQYSEVTSSDAQFLSKVKVGYEIVLRNTGAKRRVLKIVSDTMIQVNKPFHEYNNDAPVSFTNHAYQVVVKKFYDKNGVNIAGEDFDKFHSYGSDFMLHSNPKYNTGGVNSRQQGALTDERQLYSHQRISHQTDSGEVIAMQDPYLLFPPVCMNNGRCVPKTSHSLVGLEQRLLLSDGVTERKGSIMSSSTSNPVMDLVNTGVTDMFYKDCKPVCTITVTKDGISETRKVVGTVTAHNSTHLYVEQPFSYNGAGAKSQFQNQDVPGIVPAGTTAYNHMTDLSMRVRYVTGTGTASWCPNGQAGGAACDPHTVTGSAKETKTKFNSETSAQWTITVPHSSSTGCSGGETQTISSVLSDTSIVTLAAFTTTNNKENYCIGQIPALGRITSAQASKKVNGDSDTRFLEQLKVGYTISANGEDRTITSITSNTEMTVNNAFTGGINTKSAFTFSGKLGTGQVSTAVGSTDVLGTLDVTQTKFDEELAIGYVIMMGLDYRIITEITSATELKVDKAFTLQTNSNTGDTHGYYANAFNYESCFTYDIEHQRTGNPMTVMYETKSVYVEDACEIKVGCCGFQMSGVVWPDRFAYFKVRPQHSNMNIRVVATTLEDNIDLFAKKDSVPTRSSYDFTSVRESNPWALTIPAEDITCGEQYVGYDVSTSLGTQDHINAPAHGVVEDYNTLTSQQVDLTGDSSYHPSNCAFWYIGIRGDNRYPQKTGRSEYELKVFSEFAWSNFLCSDAEYDTTHSQGSTACRHLGLTSVEDAIFTLNQDDQRAVMRLVPAENMRKGAMYHSTKMYLAAGFEINFSFRISHFTVGCNSVLAPSGGCGGGDGLAFVIHDEVDGDTHIGCYGGALGYGTMTAADQGDNWARPRCLTFDAASAASKCDSGLSSIGGDITSTSDVTLSQLDDGIFSEPCGQMALCQPLDNGCGGVCGLPSCEKAIGRVLALEFDTWTNTPLHDPKQGLSVWFVNATQFTGHTDNHIAVFSSDTAEGTSTDHSGPNHFAATPSVANFADGKNHSVKVKYYPPATGSVYSRVNKKFRGTPHTTAIPTMGDCQDNTAATLSSLRNAAPDHCFAQFFSNHRAGNMAVFIDDMRKPALQVKITLRNGDQNGDCHDNDIDRCILDTQGRAYVGFTSATGGERTGVSLNPDGVSKNMHQSLISTDPQHPSIESASLQEGGAQRVEILSFGFCHKVGCVES